ncbi:hypothetical protein D3260_12390 [Salinisphaera sp. Q1T1-3]|nr:hypothetical protein D3260_12390 [Salinisphaera sp. Q1T1-3]
MRRWTRERIRPEPVQARGLFGIPRRADRRIGVAVRVPAALLSMRIGRSHDRAARTRARRLMNA